MQNAEQNVSFGDVWDRPGEVLLAREVSGRLRLLRLESESGVLPCGCCSVEQLIVRDELDHSFSDQSEIHSELVLDNNRPPRPMVSVSIDSLSDAERASLPHEFLNDLLLA